MELQLVQLVHAHHVDGLLDELLVVEVACHVHHQASPGALGGIVNLHAGNLPLGAALPTGAVYFGREELQQALDAIESTVGIRGNDSCTLGSDGKRVGLGHGHGHCVLLQDNASLGLAFLQDSNTACGARQHLLQVLGLGLERSVITDYHLLGQEVLSAFCLHLQGLGDDADGISVLCIHCGHTQECHGKR